MKPFPIPVVADLPMGPGSQIEEDTLDYMVMPSGMSTYQAPALPEREEIASLTGAHEALRLALASLDRARHGLPADPVDLMDLNDAERRLINQVLGEGEVSVRVSLSEGELVVQEAVFAGVWRVLHQVTQPGSDARVVLSDRIEVGRIPQGVLESAAARVQASGARRVRLQPEDNGAWPAGVMNAPAILTELEDHIHLWKPGTAAHVVNLTLLPLSPQDLAVIDQTLGQGPIQILSRGYGNCRIVHTEVPLTWRVSYFNSQDALILDTVEVTDLPEVACAAREDLEDSHERLADMFAWVEGA